MKPAIFPILCSAVLISAIPAPAAELGRYQLQPTPGGVVRLDTETGELAYCRESDGALSCNSIMPDEAVRKRLQALEDRIAVLEGKPPAKGLPSDDELERSFSIMEKFFRRFKGLADELGKDKREIPEEALPQKT